MQAIYKDENKKGATEETNLMGTILCAGRISRYVEEKHTGRPKGREIGV